MNQRREDWISAVVVVLFTLGYYPLVLWVPWAFGSLVVLVGVPLALLIGAWRVRPSQRRLSNWLLVAAVGPSLYALAMTGILLYFTILR